MTEKDRKSCIRTIELLRRLAYNIHGVMDVIDAENCNKIIAMLEQEPKTVIYSGDGYADGYMVYDMAECPSCGYEYEDGDKDWGENFCPHCGQPLKWESEG